MAHPLGKIVIEGWEGVVSPIHIMVIFGTFSVMKKALFTSVFVFTLFFHFLHTTHCTGFYDFKSILQAYLSEQAFYLGLAYATTATFTLYSLMQWHASWKLASAGAAGGLSILFALQLLGCWLVGCCGSPLLPVYLALLGPSFLDLAKPLVLGVTILSIGGSYLWMRRAIKHCGCEICPEGTSETSRPSVKDATLPAVSTGTKEAVQRLVNEIYTVHQIEKCRYCGCFQQVVGETVAALAEVPLTSELKDKLLEVKGNTPIAKYDCLGCDPCHAAILSNTFEGIIKKEPIEHKERVIAPEMESWPVEEGQYIIGNKEASVAISTLSDSVLYQRIVQHLGTQNIAIIGPTLTENIGVGKVVKNCISNPYIRFLILCGEDPKGHRSGASLLALLQNGIDSQGRIIGSPAIRPVLKNVDFLHVQHLRKQVQVIDLVGCDELDIIGKKVEDCARKNLTPFKETITIEGIKKVLAKPSKKLLLDPSGYFIIYPKPDKRAILVEHYPNDGTLRHIIEGDSVSEICSTIIELSLVSRLDHAAYLGRELERCRLSMELGFEFVQDRAG